ncbi:hypothetical protein E1218_12140 [Kribbella turkmenica]|uniref:Fibronectin type-III domain-containing protein n=1 Tax=Kribbella turkmenica TaxID=2530375 RepID=A0A4R4X8P4_9ACTN|nr:right-handed parallel beta-helix repeat-containing protein [Kribbella turkmenica]TDD26802.1 hypothetical protein E1218_12140 [Kribbella turkmenica]
MLQDPDRCVRRRVAVAATLLAVTAAVLTVPPASGAGRPEPVGSQTGRTVFVDDHGATANDQVDDGPAIRNAIEAARTLGPGTTVDFGAGSYVVSPPPRSWEFQSSEGWTSDDGVPATVVAGAVTIPAGADGSIDSPRNLNVEASKHRLAKWRLRNPTPASTLRISWTTQTSPEWSDEQSTTVAIAPGSDGFTDYSVDLGTRTGWSGLIKQVRFSLPDGPSGGAAELDALQFDPASAPQTGNFAFLYEGLDDLSFRGRDTQIVLTDPLAGGFRLVRSSQVSFRGFTFDYSTPPFAQGEITATDKDLGTFDFRPEAGYPILEDPRLRQVPDTWGTTRDPLNPFLQKQTAKDFIRVSSWTALDSGVYRFTVPANTKAFIGNPAHLVAGDKFVLNQRGTAPLINLTDTTAVSLRDVDVYASPASTLSALYSDSITVHNLQVRRRPGSGRWVSTNADGVHVQSARVGPIIRNSSFEGMLDDGVNIYTTPRAIVEVLADDKVVAVATGSGRLPLVGDSVQVYDPILGRVKGTAEVVDVAAVPGHTPDRRAVLTFDGSVPGMAAGADVRSGDTLYNLSTSGAGFQVTNNDFRDSRRHGVYVKSKDGLIAGNRFSYLGGAAVISQNEPNYPEGPGSTGITIRDNVMDHVGHLRAYDSPESAAIKIRADRLPYRLAEDRAQRDFLIEGNTIKHPPRNGIYIGGAENVQIRGENRIVSSSDDYAFGGDITAVKLENVASLGIDSLSVEDPRTALNAGVQIGSAAHDVKTSNLTFKLADGVPSVLRLAPAAPTRLRAARAEPDDVSLTWSGDGGTDAPTYSVYRGDIPSFVPSWRNRVAAGITTTGFVDHTSAGSATHCYRVTAVNSSALESAASAATCVRR